MGTGRCGSRNEDQRNSHKTVSIELIYLFNFRFPKTCSPFLTASPYEKYSFYIRSVKIQTHGGKKTNKKTSHLSAPWGHCRNLGPHLRFWAQATRKGRAYVTGPGLVLFLTHFLSPCPTVWGGFWTYCLFSLMQTRVRIRFSSWVKVWRV